MQLRDLNPDKRRRERFLPGNQEYRKKLFSLGVLPNTQFEVTRVAPLGDPIEIKLRGSFISVRKAEIEIIDVYPL